MRGTCSQNGHGLGYGAFAGGRFEVAEKFSATLSSIHGTIARSCDRYEFLGVIPIMLCLATAWGVYLLQKARRGAWSKGCEALDVL